MAQEQIVHVVDDDPAIRSSLKWLIESVNLKVRTYGSAQEFLDAYEPDDPGCLVLDVRMPGMSGLDLQEVLNGRGIRIPVIILTGYGDVPMAVRAMKNGAVDFLEKPVSDQVLLDHIQQALAQDVENQRQQAEQNEIRERLARLTPREKEVMDLVVEGFSSRQIAENLGVSFKTIEAHRSKIMKKTEAKSVSQLIRMTMSLGSHQQ